MIDEKSVQYGDLFQPITSNSFLMFVAWTDEFDRDGQIWLGLWLEGTMTKTRGMNARHDGGPFWARVTAE